ncbi:MAG: Na+/H+ antiporter NhaC family protein [Flammeovirgaceae bacterium]
MSQHKQPTLIDALIPIIFLIGFLIVSVVIVFGDDSISGANQMSLLFAAAVGVVVAIRLGYTWDEIQVGIVKSISSAMSALIILLIIGALVGTWMLSGVVPAMIYYGLQLLNPTIFLFAACIICAIVSIATGSSWTTIATIGVALITIGQQLGLGVGVTAGAIISGAYFGDKMSPLSDTTNLAPAMAGTDLFTHIRYMLYTTVPSISIALVLFLIIGFTQDVTSTESSINEVLNAINGTFNITPWVFLVPAAVVFMIVKKIPAIPALFVGTLLGGVFALIFQGELINHLAQNDGIVIKAAAEAASVDAAKLTEEMKAAFVADNQAFSSFVIFMKSLYQETVISTGLPALDDEGLLNGKGMSSMLGTIWLIICAMTFGGVMEVSGLLDRLTKEIIKFAKSTGSLIASTATTCFVFNITTSDQYLAIVVPGRMFAKTFKDRGLAPENLSRTLEDSGTVTSVLIPWNTCGAFQSSVLNVATGEYLMYCFFNIISPIMTVLVGYLGIKIRYITQGKEAEELVATNENAS